ncbi:MAG: hypothetical protein IKD72_02985 [Clostridia bacterium]|nr:hypothetical protein [Clostridia bacterium]
MQDNRRPPRPPGQPDRWGRLEWEISNAPLGPGISHNLIVQLLPCIEKAQQLCADDERRPALRKDCGQIRASCARAERLLREALPGTAEERSSRCRLVAFQKQMDEAARQLFLSLDRQPPPAAPCGILLPLQALLTGCRRFCAVADGFPLTPALRHALPRVRALLFQSSRTAAGAASRHHCK